MAHRYEPISLGSPRFRTVETGAFRLTEAWFPPGLVLPPHLHERATVAVMLEGSFEVIFGSRSLESFPSTLHTEPLGEKHGNRMGRAGAHVLVLQPDPAQEELFRPCSALLERVHRQPRGGLGGLAWRIALELRAPDPVTPLALEGLSFELVTAAARLNRRPPPATPPAPRWLEQAEEFLRAGFDQPLRIAEVARAVGVHPAHLARVFRAHHRMPIGAFVRGLRLEWSARRLATSREPLSAIALRAGFADQAHFTRTFKRHTGLTPQRFRQSLAS